MARHPLFNQFTRTIRTAWFAEQNGLTTREALEGASWRPAERPSGVDPPRVPRRPRARRGVGHSRHGRRPRCPGPCKTTRRQPQHRDRRGGHGGARVRRSPEGGRNPRDRLRSGADRVGGRVRSIPDVFPGRTIELGGEFIDYWHATILKYVRRFDLPRSISFDTAGGPLPHRRRDLPRVDDHRRLPDVVLRMKADMRSVTSGISARNFDPAPNSADRRLDNTNLQEYRADRPRTCC